MTSRKPAVTREVILRHAERSLKLLIKVLRSNRTAVSRLPEKKAILDAQVTLVNSNKMKSINGAYRKQFKATDVLSFPAPEVFQKQGFLGELVICESVLKKQAKEMGHSWKTELDILIVHGLLHLCHFDHEVSDSEMKVMQKLEKALFSKKKRVQPLIERATARAR